MTSEQILFNACHSQDDLIEVNRIKAQLLELFSYHNINTQDKEICLDFLNKYRTKEHLKKVYLTYIFIEEAESQKTIETLK